MVAGEGDGALTGRVLRIVAGTYHVETPAGELECTLRGRVKAGSGGHVAVGDLVRVERLAEGSCRILELLPRRTVLARHGVARRREQVIAANVDQVGAVVSVAAPEPDLAMVDRLLALAALNSLDGFIVLNKIDLSPGGSGQLPPSFAPYRDAGYSILCTSARSGVGLPALGARLADRVTAFAGSSGVGKSSLLNSLVPGVELRVGDVGQTRGRGRHTTVAARLIPLPDGGYVADTPGLQVLALWEADGRELGDAFLEFREPAAECRFSDCRHDQEPDCAVRSAIDAGRISPRRHRSYLSLLREAQEGRG